MSDLLKVKVGGSSYLCKFSYPAPLPSGYKRVKYIELNGTGYPITASSFNTQRILKDLKSEDTIEIEMQFTDSPVVTSSNFFVFWELNTKGTLKIYNDTIDMTFQEYRSIAVNNLNNLGRNIYIKRSARAIRPGDVVPYGYSYVGQLTVDGVLYEYDIYNNLQSIDSYSQYGSFFDYSNGGDYSGIAGTKIFKLIMKEYLTDRVKYDFVPCIRESDSRPGFYDLYHDYFLISRDNGVWSAGPLK